MRIGISVTKSKTFVNSVRMASTSRTAASFIFDKAYVDGQWVSSKSGKTFPGIFYLIFTR